MYLTDAIALSEGDIISFYASTLNESVSAITLCQSDGTPIRMLVRGLAANAKGYFTYVAETDCYVRLSFYDRDATIIWIIPQTYALPFVRRDVDNVTYYLQNGLLAMINLQPQYWLYDMPARNLIVNGVQVWAYGIQRRKSQTVTFPIGNDDPDLMGLVKTQIGNGQFEKISINLSSRTAKATLKHDTE